MRKLEIGPDVKRIGPEWETLSVQRGPQIDYIADITEPIRVVPNGQYDLVYASHVFEHVPWFMVVKAMRNVWRIIKPGGRLEVWVPDFNKVLEVFRNPESMKKDRFRQHNKLMDHMLWVNGRVFAGHSSKMKLYTKISVWHKCLFDKPFLIRCLKRAGYTSFHDLQTPRGYDHGFIGLGVGAIK